MHGITRATLALGLGLGALAACTDGNKASESSSRPEGLRSGPGTSGAPQGGGTAAATGGGAGTGAAAAPGDSAGAAAAGTTPGVAPADSARRDSTTPPPR